MRAATQHPITESARIHEFRDILQSLPTSGGNEHAVPADALCRLGDLMMESHASYSRCGLGSPNTDLLVDLVQQHRAQHGPQATVFGARVTGGGCGGCVCIVARSGAAGMAAVEAIVAAFTAASGLPTAPCLVGGSSDGAAAFGTVQVVLDAL